MDNRSSVQENKTDSSSSFPLTSRTYKTIRENSRSIGRTAMKAVSDMKDFLKKEIPLPTAEQLLGILPSRQKVMSQAAEDATEKLKNIVSKSHEILVSVSTVFPVTLFPDTLTIDRTKITIIKRDFFWMERVISIRIEDVLNVTVNTGPFFGSISIASRIMNSTDHFELNYFWRNEAVYLSHLIQGYVIAQHNNIDTNHLDREELINTIKELGSSASHVT